MLSHRFMSRRILTALLLGSLSACHTWTHAPGHEQRETMTRVEMPWVMGEFCSYGWCNLEGPDGEIKIADVHVEGVSDARTATRFKVRYRGAQASCMHPSPDGSPLSCEIAEGAAQPPVQRLEVDLGCTTARIIPASTDMPNETPLMLRTDVVEVLGVESPAREVALMDRQGVRAFSDAPGNGLVFFTRPRTAMQSTAIVAMVAYHAFLDMEGKVPQCMTGGVTLARAERPGETL